MDNLNSFSREFNKKNLDIEAKKADVEKRRKEELELMLKEKAVEINENDFDFKLFGVPDGFDIDSGNADETNFYQTFYDGDTSETKVNLINRSGKIIYVYKKNNFISKEGRPGAFLGMSVELNNIYCIDFERLERFFHYIFEKLIVDRYKILEKTNSSEIPYRFNVNTFQSNAFAQVVAEIKDIILKNFRNAFKDDFRKIDENFKNFIKSHDPGELFILHKVSKITNWTDEKGIPHTIEGNVRPIYKKDLENAETIETIPIDQKPFNSNYFDFDRNVINAKYDKEFAQLEEAEKT